ncbi:hypothetical protein PF005_g22519 [Phytophthora fragariae]|uniref:Uncharacterized protein n=1 Tax=Phytophthora fragariae TaxID=53985 RepID=A0A6A3I3A7_9STRA|nr:hypothetical protein PF003_g11645 [Phytophthora fragariae]KAE8923982.1 hypothetical protein PF009_g25778 [Phytophthora fragariae]KAE8976690.1 hypothetical protein PF011_g23942 [Phytophthora fragariae]KAE9074966.1 hypothetical protein PF010_g24479 [Phytophthora fragariae]KAE9094469.1 hypothetical protein PF006_g24210 [Phytophthora fragariae]
MLSVSFLSSTLNSSHARAHVAASWSLTCKSSRKVLSRCWVTTLTASAATDGGG